MQLRSTRVTVLTAGAFGTLALGVVLAGPAGAAGTATPSPSAPVSASATPRPAATVAPTPVPSAAPSVIQVPAGNARVVGHETGNSTMELIGLLGGGVVLAGTVTVVLVRRRS